MSLIIEEHCDLTPFNTLRLSSVARYLAHITSEADLEEFFENEALRGLPFFVLGDGSNTFFTKDFDGVVLKNEFRGRTIVDESDHHVVWEIGGGENWHEIVTEAVKQKLHGIEALALIPGTVGAAPVQNIAAYGQNFEDVFETCDAYDLSSGERRTFTKADAEFAYRTSIFKKRNDYCITKVRLKLHKDMTDIPTYISTGAVRDSLTEELKTFAQEPYEPIDIFEAVIRIRSRKLLDPKEAPTAGSFFLNPIIKREKAEELSTRVPNLQWYPAYDLSYTKDVEHDENSLYVKVAVARLIDHLGWRGKHIGNCHVSSHHALLVTHNGNATPEELQQFVTTLQKDFKDAYGFDLEFELTVV